MSEPYIHLLNDEWTRKEPTPTPTPESTPTPTPEPPSTPDPTPIVPPTPPSTESEVTPDMKALVASRVAEVMAKESVNKTK